MIEKNINNETLTSMIEVPVLDEISESVSLTDSYATGRRKESVAKCWLTINRKEKFSIQKIKDGFNVYFNNEALSHNAVSPLILLDETQNFAFNFNIKFKLIGGGKSGQSDALKLAFSKALTLLFPDMRSILRKNGFLTSDSRKKEREHPGFRTSRKPQQYSRR
ncbi:30S ribosomal protein S9 [Alphaproteobacteria bacterium endosymbiont of Tiliacea citrago]|uniref:30S ribosomal protein S9 n=1 Tax=Alphaproteobacteria bacterium endosymbiont of Tiliacea citrago TaxID=3077944 RepID=UPI00313C4B76